MNESNQLEKALALFMERTGQQELWAKCLQEASDISPGNAISVIFPYRHNGMWVFDDPDKALIKEPFVSGADTAIDLALAELNIKDADKGFRMVFSATEFPGSQFTLEWEGPEAGGNLYHCDELDQEAWLCPALLKYFAAPPEQIYVKVEPRSKN